MKAAEFMKRALAVTLCVAMLSSNGISVAAEDNAETQVTTESETAAPSTAAESTAAPETAKESTTTRETAAKESTSASGESTAAESTQTTEATETTETETTETETTETETEVPDKTVFDYTAEDNSVHVIVTLKNEADLPAGAKLKVTPVTVTDEIQEKAEEDAVSEKKAITSIKAYDISFHVGDKEVEPGATVSVQVSVPEVGADDDADVYHYDEESNVLNDMNADVASNGDITFDTNHFSTYVIVNKSSKAVRVTINHIIAGTNKKIYASDVRELEAGSRINDYKKAVNWTVSKVEKVSKGVTTDITAEANADKDVQINTDTIINVYYTARTTSSFGNVTFYDYQLNHSYDYDYDYYYGWQEASINDSDHYAGNSNNNRMIMGTKAQNNELASQGYNAYGSNKLNANDYNNANITTGLVKDMTYDDKAKKYTTVNWNVDQPGFFTSDNAGSNTGKQVYDDYALKFNQSGDTYTFQQVVKRSDTSKGLEHGIAGQNFFPMKDVSDKPYDSADSEGKYYFGMRYDVFFTLGDYVGDLNYHFTGDDDLWVLLDGKVVIDVGGIHDALSGDADLWKALGIADPNNLTEEQKNQEHQLTVLYMERGAGQSNCQMNFTIPNAQIITTSSTQASLTIHKVNKARNPLSGAMFKLVDEKTAATYTSSPSTAEGMATFSGIPVGTYQMTETMAPDGYTAQSGEFWIVKVTSSDDDAGNTTTQAVLYEADGTTEVKDNVVVNYTAQELLESQLEYSKSVKLTNWNDRTYQITLNADSIVTKTTTETKGGVADVMLVLDRSGSMNRSVTYSNTVEDGKFGDIMAWLKSAKYSWLSKDYYYFVKDGEKEYIRYSYGDWWYWDNREKTREWVIGAGETVYHDETITSKKLDMLKTSAKAFITDMAEKSPTSKVGIVSYSAEKSGSFTINCAVCSIGQNKEKLISAISNMTAGGGTSPYLGLNSAKNQLDSNRSDGNPQYAILFTDGEPTGDGNTWNQQTANRTVSSASLLKTAQVTLFTIGFGVSPAAKSWLSDSIASPDCALTADDQSGLSKIFTTISNTITNNIDITGAAVTDVVDSRFELSDAEKTRLEKDGAYITENQDGTTSVAWSDQTIPNKTKGEWTKNINIVAKTDYAGGNDVTTNADGSGIVIGGATADFSKPTVNVKMQLSGIKDYDTIFKGDSLAEYIYDGAQEGAKGYTDARSFDRTATDVTQGDAANTVWYQDADCTKKVTANGVTEGSLAALQAQTPAGDSCYYSKSTVTLSSDGSGSALNMKSDSGNAVMSDGTKYYTNTDAAAISEYQIYVVDGEMTITKKIDQKYTDETATKSNQSFIYKINRYSAADVTDGKLKDGAQPVETRYEVLNFSANKGTKKLTSAKLTNLGKGYYTVSEESSWSSSYEENTSARKDNYDGNATENCLLYIGSRLSSYSKVQPDFYGTATAYADSTAKTNVVDEKNIAVTRKVNGDSATTAFSNKKKAIDWLTDVADAINSLVR